MLKWEGELEIVTAIYRGGPPATELARVRILVDEASGQVTAGRVRPAPFEAEATPLPITWSGVGSLYLPSVLRALCMAAGRKTAPVDLNA